MPETSTIIFWVALALAAYFLGLPLLILNILKMKLDTGPTEIDSVHLTQDDLAFLDNAEASLQALGYIPVGRFSAGDMVPNVETAFTMLVHPDGYHAVLAVIMKSTNQPAKRYIEFATEAEDGREFNTANAHDIPARGESPDKFNLRAPRVADIERLENLHRLFIADQAGSAPLYPVPLDLPPGEFLRDELREELEEKVSRGWWRETSQPYVYQLTIKGAYLMTWGELWPIKPIRRMRYNRWARKKQDELESNDPAFGD